MRATEVIYDRAHSSFAEAPADAWDWDALLAGVDRLHLSGITPALGPRARASRHRRRRSRGSARHRGVVRRQLARAVVGALGQRPARDPDALIGHADVLFGNHRDVVAAARRALLTATAPTGGARRPRPRSRTFPKLQTIASTARHADRRRSQPRVRAHRHARARRQTDEVADHRHRRPDRRGRRLRQRRPARRCAAAWRLEDRAETGLALTALKHSLPGDASLFAQADIDAFLAGRLDVRR